MHLEAHGIKVDCPVGWDAKIFRHDERDLRAAGAQADEPAAPTLHAATFALPLEDGDWATAAQELMNADDSLLVLKEFVPDSKLRPGKGLFAPAGKPSDLSRDQFHPRSLLRDLPGQSGYQSFFTEGGRPFGLYVVLGGAQADLTAVNRVIDTAELEPAR